MRYRVRLVPSHDGTNLAVIQVKWLGLIWRDYELLQGKLHKKQKELVEAYRKLHRLATEVKEEADGVTAALNDVVNFGDRLRATGPEWTDNKLPFFLKIQAPFLGPGKKDVDAVLKAIQSGDYKDPDDLGIKWPPNRPPSGGKRSAYLLEPNHMEAIISGIVREGEPYDHVVKYRKPQDNRQNQNQKGKGGNQNQQNNQQGNKGGNN
jgi:hypothetical protein